MHICLVCNFLYPTALYGGIEKHVYTLGEGLSEAGFDVSILTSDLFTYSGKGFHTTSESHHRNINVEHLHAFANLLNNPITPRLLFKLLTRNDFDLVHCHDHYYFGSLISASVRRVKQKPLVLTLHTSEIRYRQRLSRLIRGIYDRSFSKYVLTACDRIIVLSEALRKAAVGDGLSLAKIRCIPNGIDFDEFGASAGGPLKGRGQSVELLFVGRLVERKGLHVLLEAVKFISPQVDCRLVVVGDGPRRRALENLSKALGIDSNVSFLGHVSQAELIAAYQSADILVLPSISGEVQPFVLLEALAFHKAFIATKVGGIPDLEHHGISGYYVEPEDSTAIAEAVVDFSQLKTDPSIHSSANDNWLIAKQEFSSERMVKNTIAVYDELM